MPHFAPRPPRESTPIGDWLRASRTAYGYDHDDLAQVLSVSPEQFARWEETGSIPTNKGRRRTLNTYARKAGLPELAFRADVREDTRRH